MSLSPHYRLASRHHATSPSPLSCHGHWSLPGWVITCIRSSIITQYQKYVGWHEETPLASPVSPLITGYRHHHLHYYHHEYTLITVTTLLLHVITPHTTTIRQTTYHYYCYLLAVSYCFIEHYCYRCLTYDIITLRHEYSYYVIAIVIIPLLPLLFHYWHYYHIGVTLLLLPWILRHYIIIRVTIGYRITIG